MSRKSKIGREYALVLAKYVARFHQVPPSILTEATAMELMLESLRLDEPVELRPRSPSSRNGARP